MHGHCVVEHGLCIEVCDTENNYLHASLTKAYILLLPSPNTSSLSDVCFGSLLQHQYMYLDIELAFGLLRQLSMVWLVQSVHSVLLWHRLSCCSSNLHVHLDLNCQSSLLVACVSTPQLSSSE